MFKKLKQKISEEQQQQLQQQASSNSSTPTRSRSRTSSFTDQLDEVTPNRELLAGMIAEPAFLSEYTVFALDSSKQPKAQSDSVNASHATKSPDGVTRSESSTPQSGDTQTFTQKLQLRVPSVESLFRSPIKESLFRSSKESLVRASSRESLNQLDLDCSPAFDPPSDMESEAEDAQGAPGNLSTEQLLQRLRRMERSLSSYRGKYSEIVTAYQTLQREKKKLQGILSQSQDKSLRRISELREELQMDQQAKKHLQDEFDASLEEKDQIISVLQTQVSLLKQRLRNGPVNVDVPKPLPPMDSHAEVGKHEEITESVGEPIGGDASMKTLETLQQRVRRQENLLQRCKESLQSRKEQCTLLASEKEALQEQLDERLQELEKMKGMVITETKRQMHETLELKDEEITQLRSRIRQMTTQGEELREQKEKSERAAFEELEKALSAAQKSEEAQRKMKAEMDEQIKAIETSSEEERASLQHELSRVKQEVAELMKKSSEEQVVKLQKLHEKELASREQELTKKLQAQERELQDQLKIALEKSRSEYLKLIQEKEQQGSLALEELELQKKAILVESENKLLELQQETEAYRTRILELETSLEKSLEESKTQSEQLAVHLEAEKNKHNKEITIMVEKHKSELESLQHQQSDLWAERLQALEQQHQTYVETLREKYEQEKETLLKDKEVLFQAHIQDMNERTLEKLDVKQTELESLSSELSEVLQGRDRLVEELSALRDQADNMKQELEAKLDEQKSHHQQEVDSIMKDHELSLQRAEATLKDQIQQLGLVLQEKDEHLRELQARLGSLEAHSRRADGELQQASAQLSAVQSRQSSSHEQARAFEERLAQLQQTVIDLEAERDLLTKRVAETEAEKKDVCLAVDAHKAQVRQLEQRNEELERKVESLSQLCESQRKDRDTEQEQARQLLMDKENMIVQMRGQSQEIEILKQKLSSKEDSISVLQEDYESKLKTQEKKIEKIKQKVKEMQETKKKLLDQEARLKKELENTVLELSHKEQQFRAQVLELELAQANAAGLSDVVSRLETSHKEQMESLASGHQRELSEVISSWERKLSEQAEELREKHGVQLQERELEVAELKQQVILCGREKEEMSQEIAGLKEEGGRQGAALAELQEQLRQQSVHLAQNEATLQTHMQELEAERTRSLAEKASLQEQLAELRTLAEREQTWKLQVSELTGKLKTTEAEFQSLKSLHERREKSLEDKSLEFKALLEEVVLRKTGALLEAKTNELMAISSGKTSAVLTRLSRCQHQAAEVREALLVKARRVSELQGQLEALAEERHTLKSSLQHATLQLEEKEGQIRNLKTDIKGLVTEKEALQKEGGHQQQAASEKESCITQLKKELSENINAVTLMREELAEKKHEISSLRAQLTELSAQLQSSVSQSEKDAAIASLSARYDGQQRKLQEQVRDLSLEVDTLSREKTSALEQAGHWSSKLSEWKAEAQAECARYQSTIRELQAQLELKAKEASEKEGRIHLLKEDLDQQSKRIESLQGEMEDKKSSMEKKECSLETELKTQTARMAELEDRISQKQVEVEALNEALRDCTRQKDAEQKELLQKLERFREQGEEKDNRVQEAEDRVSRLEKQVCFLEAELETKIKELDQVSSSARSKEDELKALRERLEQESASKAAELKKKAEQKVAAIRKQLLSQMEEKEQRYKAGAANQLSELSAKLQEREEQVHVLEEKLKTMEITSQSETPVVSRSIVNEAACAERAAEPPGCAPKECEGSFPEKESVPPKGREEAATPHAALQCGSRELPAKLERAEAKQREDLELMDHLQEELEEKKKYCLIVSQHMEAGGGENNTGTKKNWENVVDGFQKTLKEKELTCQNLQQKIKELESDLAREKDVHRAEVEELASKYGKLQTSQQDTDGKTKPSRVLEDSPEEKSSSQEIQRQVLSPVKAQPRDLEAELAGAEREKQRLSKDIARLQKDLRMLRKEHQQELDILKKECEQEMEEKIKQEQEDLELKHGSMLKQLMREFNTQLAQKEQELERTIKETIDKAQEVEAELLESHQEETNQLRKKIAEKDDDLKRTAKRYEEILDAREEEMTAKVNDLQTQLEELQEKYEHKLQQEEQAGSHSVAIMELQTQLAQKTTLISDSKLREQEFREQIHNLEDRLKKYEKNIYATTVGTPYKGSNLYHTDVSLLGEPTEFEYLRKVLFEYMMGRETKTMAKVITTVLKFPDDQTQKILEREDARLMFPSPRSGIF
uniref:golgin subfamily A member 4 isoform X5 n=1 Tax=Jaculus jaculus TaxID=51337 RepID=UPI001E1AF7A3|nr:golgin subfamily A member 4 isoform X5 [Jaculus jaculus]